jgi:protein SCO1/2
MRMARVQEQVLLDEHVRLLSISVDPAYDTPERLAAYAASYRANPTKWRWVTGAPDKIHALVEQGFLASMERDGVQKNGAPSIAHAGYFMLVDGDLHLRGTYSTSDFRIDDLVRDARRLARGTR